MFLLLHHELRRNGHDGTPDGLSCVQSHIEIFLNLEDAEVLFGVDSLREDGVRDGDVDELAE